jgi:hypothetical protein
LIEERNFSQNAGQLKQKYDVVAVRPEKGVRKPYDDILFHDAWGTFYSVYTKVLDIKSSVFFILLDREGKIERTFRNTEELLSFVSKG